MPVWGAYSVLVEGMGAPPISLWEMGALLFLANYGLSLMGSRLREPIELPVERAVERALRRTREELGIPALDTQGGDNRVHNHKRPWRPENVPL